MATITYSDHARRQTGKRGITEEDVELALRRVNRTSPGEPGTIWIHGQASGGRILKVCTTLPDKTHVITAAWPDAR